MSVFNTTTIPNENKHTPLKDWMNTNATKAEGAKITLQ